MHPCDRIGLGQGLKRLGAAVQRRPIVAAALLFALGTYIGLQGSGAVLVVAVVWALLAAPGLLCRTGTGTALAIYPAITLIAAVLAGYSGGSFSRDSVAELMEVRSEYLELRGVVAYQPVCYESSFAGGGRLCYFDLEIDSVRRSSEWVAVRDRARVRLDLPQSTAAVRYGERLELAGVLSLAADAGSYRRSGTPTLDSRAADMQILSHGNGSRLVALCLNLRAAGDRLLQKGIESHPREAGLLKALLLGRREELDRSVYDTFSETGTVHILAISGLHVGLIAFFIIFALRWLGIPRTRWYLLVIPLLCLYTIGTGMRASAVRACLMASIYLLAPPLKRSPNALCALALSAIIILAAAPEQILEPGFQFSFAIVAGILVFLPYFNPLGFALQRKDPLKIESEPKLLGWFKAGIGRLYFLLAVSLVAWSISTPLAMYYANMFSPIAVLANLVVVPLISFVVGAGVVAMVFGGFLSPIAVLFNNINRLALTALIQFVSAVSQVPGGVVYTRSPSPLFILSYYLLLTGVFFFKRTRTRLLCAAALPLLIGAHICIPTIESLRMEVRDGERTPVALIEFGDKSNILIDTGPEYFARELRNWLRARGVNRIDRLILSQVGQRHAGGLAALLDKFDVEQIWIPDYDSRSPLMDELRKLDENSAIELRMMRSGDVVDLPNGFRVEFFNPLADVQFSNSGEACSVFRVAGDDFGVMFVGGHIDRRVFDQPRDLAAPIWVLDDGDIRREATWPKILHYSPELLICGGEVRPPAGTRADSWLLRRKGSYVIE